MGGTPRGTHKLREGEWLAPESVGAERVTLKKGDILAIPRGTLHKRTTDGEVSFLLISTIAEQ